MKKYILILCCALFNSNSFCLEVRFVGPCSDKPLFVSQSSGSFSNIGELTLALLKTNNIPFEGTEAGINQMFGTPIGADAMEVSSEDEMRAYGWCFDIDGKIPEVFPHEIPVTNDIKTIRWFFGYAHMKEGVWVSQCEESFLRHPQFICGK